MNKFFRILITILIIWGIIYELSFIFSFEKKYPEEAYFETVAKVVSLKTEKEKSNSYDIKILNSNIKNAKNTKIILYTAKEIDLKYGDIIKISGTFSKADTARNYKGFDYRKYLKQKKIYGSMYVKEVDVITHEKSIIEKIFVLKNKCLNTIDKIYNGDTCAFLKGILLGDSSEVDEKIEENFRNSSMSHILAISGMHVSYVIIGMQFILDKLLNDKKIKNCILIGLLLFFAIITGGAPSCIRACIMNAVLLISQNLYRKNSFYVSFTFTFLVLILLNPYNIFSVGMWLSFGGTLGIVLFHKFLTRFFICKLKIKPKFWKNFLEIFLVSFSAQITILPIMVYNFNTISLTFFISNLLIYFLIGPILAFGYISLIMGIFILPIGKFIGVLENFLVFLILKIAEICSKLPFSKIYLPTPNFFTVILYYVIMVIVIFIFYKYRFNVLKFILGDGFRKFLKKQYKKMIEITLIIVVLSNLYTNIPKNLKLYFVDVGQR